MPDKPPLPPEILASRTGGSDLGTPRFLWFDGILEAPLHDPQALRELVAEVNAAGYAKLDLEESAGRFSLLMDSTVRRGAELGGAGSRESFLESLGRLPQILESGRQIESTLRCTEVFPTAVRETLFAFDGEELRAVDRTRPVRPEDLARAPAEGAAQALAPLERIGRRRLLLITALFALGLAVLAWRYGLLDRLFAPGVDSVGVEYGAYAGLLEVEKTSSWGNYEITVKRGPEFPATKEKLAELLEKCEEMEKRAAINAVANGAAVYLRLETADGEVLALDRVELHPLLGKADAEIEARLPGRIGGKRIQLAAEAGRGSK